MKIINNIKNTFNKPVVILINGKKRSGKDFCAEVIKQKLKKKGIEVSILHFADKLKQAMCVTFNITEEELEELKNQTNNNITIKGLGGYPNSKGVKETSFRTILQRFGTEAMKPIFGEDVWVRLLEQQIKESNADVILVPDFRFKIESTLSHFMSVKVIGANDEKGNDTHASENDLNNFYFNAEIDNSSVNVNCKDFKKSIKGVVNNITKKVMKTKEAQEKLDKSFEGLKKIIKQHKIEFKLLLQNIQNKFIKFNEYLNK